MSGSWTWSSPFLASVWSCDYLIRWCGGLHELTFKCWICFEHHLVMEYSSFKYRKIQFVNIFKYILLIMLVHLSHFFLPFTPLCPVPSLPPISLPPYFMSMGRTYKFFGFSISHTILNLPFCKYLSISLFYAYQLSFLLPVPFPPFFLSPSPLRTLHVISISVILFLF